MQRVGVYTDKKRNLIEVYIDGFDPSTVSGNVSVVQNGQVIPSKAEARRGEKGLIDIVLEKHVDKGPIEVIISDRVLNEHSRPIFGDSIAIGTLTVRP